MSLDQFFSQMERAIEELTLQKLILSKKRFKSSDLKTVTVKPIRLKDNIWLSFTYRHDTRDVTKNYKVEDGIVEMRKMLAEQFFQADLFGTELNWHLLIYKSGKAKLKQKAASGADQETKSDPVAKPELTHDHQKRRLINPKKNVYLHELGVTDATGKVKNDSQDKFRQINKYIEIIEGVLKSVNLPDDPKVVDMGAGKGYLTFALYDYLYNQLSKDPMMFGVEMRSELVDTCNEIAEKAEFDSLFFQTGMIKEVAVPDMDLLIALHACDIATDEAIYRGIKAGAEVIICAPCCHKQVRKSMKTEGDLAAITKFGIMEERQAELLTDTIRALILESYGYKTRVFEFISTSHTPKNVMIVATKRKDGQKDQEAGEKVERIKKTFGIKSHYLQEVLRNES